MTTTTTPHPGSDLRAALAARTRPRHPGAITTSLVFGWRARVRITRVPAQLFDVMVHPVVFTLMFTYLFGGTVSGSTSRYLTTLVPGILVMPLLVTTGTTGSTLSLDIGKGVFDRFRTLPIWAPSALVGALLGDLARYMAASTLVVGLGLALGLRPAGGVAGVLTAVLLALVFCFALSWAWTALALSLKPPAPCSA
jgi:ABC-2 type transport system permease protein